MLHHQTTVFKNTRNIVIVIFLALLVSTQTFSKETNNKFDLVSSKTKAVKQDNNYKPQDPLEMTELDDLFIELRSAAFKNDANKANLLANKLSHYDIADYVEYFRIRPKLYDSSGKPKVDTDAHKEVELFLKKYTGTALADRMRNDWLLNLGKRKDWIIFDREYAKFVLDDDTQVKCYAMMSRLAHGENPKEVGQMAKATLLDPKYYGDACPDLIQALLQVNGLSVSEGQTFGRGALEMNFDSAAKKMSGDDPISDILKKVRANPSAVYKSLESIQFNGLGELRSPVLAYIGELLAKKQDPNAIEAFRKQNEIGFNQYLSTENMEWKVRAALKEKDWRLVKASIEAMPEALRLRDPAWTYWYAKSLKELKEKKASEYFSQISQQYNFYGQLALEELGQVITIPPSISLTDAELSAPAKNPAFLKAAKLYGMNLRTEGNREWNWELRGASDRELIAIAEYGKNIGLLDRAVNTADRTKTEHDFSLRYPTPFADKLLPISSKLKVNINWVYGLIRQESRFIMNARSGVGASGLMQVMPATGQFVAKKIGLSNFKASDLTELQTNLLIGTSYLGMVLDDLGGSWGLASAAYNAGPGRPKSWRQSLSNPVEGAIFAEIIPFNETRGYVKNVLSNANYYEIISTGKSHSLKEKLGTVQPAAYTSSNLP